MPLEVLYKPSLIQELDPHEILEIFNGLAKNLTFEPPLINLDNIKDEAIFIGDTHGDFSITTFIAKKFLINPDNYVLIFLGDYIDREPEHEGSLYNLLYLCILKKFFPYRVYLLKGNHEAHYSVYCYPYEFDRVLIDTFGKYGVDIHTAATELFKEMPLMIKTENGIVASHAGFPLRGQSINDKSRKDLIIDIAWADVSISPIYRGYDIPKFTEKDLSKFLALMNAKCFIRGHDPYVAGKIIFSKKCITLSTSRTYRAKAGITIAKAKLSEQINDADDIFLEDLTFFLDSFE